MDVVIANVPTVDGPTLFRLFDAVGWIAPKSAKPARHTKIDGISNHTLYLDGPHESAFLEATFRASTAVYAATVSGIVVGVVRVISDHLQRSVVYDLVVDPAYQALGIGTRLVERCLEDFGHTQITLGTATGTMPFYERMGFVRSGSYLERATEGPTSLNAKA